MKIEFLFYIIFIAFVVVPCESTAQKYNERNFKLIAHRGGVVNKKHEDDSIGAIREAIRQSYWMVEIDLRESADGKVIVHHNAHFKEYYNNSHSVSAMTWDEIKQLRTDSEGTRPPLFEEIAALAKGKIKLMLDIKGNDFSDQFYQQIDNILKRNNLLSSTFILSGSQAISYFSTKQPYTAIGYQELLKKTKDSIDVSKHYYLLELPRNLNKKEIYNAKKQGVVVIAAINEFRYKQMKDPWKSVKKDIDQLINYGVKYFQIDSKYRFLFNK